ncbi:glycine cleavage system protein GcvH [Methyloradius palustris]|uniref:Glycine cleavage system H protein n=1 Tax=Methyloradius palustris TaxID=2778876 RepID=A0A8D5G983_9PROT|nr:glycine cleavage system protein GcvH [Methyloradius palustris]BCM23956.1 glycine cleavage system H protein [Methyloradius palustris]
MKIPAELKYTAEHLWVKAQDDGTYLAGITDYAQDLLGDIVYVEAPAVGTELSAGKPCGLVESVKTGSDLHAPVSGAVIAINEELQGTPELINENTYEAWIFKLTPSSPNEINDLLDAEAYQKILGE